MIVAISQRNIKVEKRANRDILENDYVQYYEGFGLTLMPIPNASRDVYKYFDNIKINGIILTGGGDVNQALYRKIPKNKENLGPRDNTEKKLIEIALKKHLPLLANCRGAQFTNVFFGGSLVQNLKGKTGFNHVGKIHKVSIIDDKAVNFYKKNSFKVNSYHNHGIDKNTLSKKLKPFAISEDGIIEGFYHPKHPIAGVLWHPERKGSDKGADRKLIKAFIHRRFFWNK